ncbi:unnamed protein product [Toxocara canis]|uniref:Reticulon-like protein n=1 Tax=Toxocara canis TaxID=6265 RepID=A0A183UM45_TOXCA|nr:unnamed protein product [Toxocara canis]
MTHLAFIYSDWRCCFSEIISVLDLIYWRNPKKSAVVLSLTILLLLVFAKYPLITVLSYLGLAVLGGTLGFRLYKIAEAQLRKTDGANPFQPYLEKELTMPQERVHQQVDVLIEHGQVVVNQLRRLFLVENIAESAKFGLLLWALTYVGSWFSGLCILLLVVLGIFSIPKFYETYQEPIDRNLGVAKEQVNNITNTYVCRHRSERLPSKFLQLFMRYKFQDAREATFSEEGDRLRS